MQNGILGDVVIVGIDDDPGPGVVTAIQLEVNIGKDVAGPNDDCIAGGDRVTA